MLNLRLCKKSCCANQFCSNLRWLSADRGCGQTEQDASSAELSIICKQCSPSCSIWPRPQSAGIHTVRGAISAGCWLQQLAGSSNLPAPAACWQEGCPGKICINWLVAPKTEAQKPFMIAHLEATESWGERISSRNWFVCSRNGMASVCLSPNRVCSRNTGSWDSPIRILSSVKRLEKFDFCFKYSTRSRQVVMNFWKKLISSF